MAHSNEMLFRVLNFAILAGILGYLIKKNAGAFFSARSEAIRSGMDQARELLKQSELRAGAITQKVARLEGEIASLRQAATTEIAAEHARIERQTEERVRKIFAQAGQEMQAAAKAARQELKVYAASLAVGLAERKIAARLTGQTQQALVDQFVRGLR